MAIITYRKVSSYFNVSALAVMVDTAVYSVFLGLMVPMGKINQRSTLTKLYTCTTIACEVNFCPWLEW